MDPSPDPKKRAQPSWDKLFKPPRPFVPKTLDELVKWSEETTEGLMRNTGSVPPLLIVLGEEGVQIMSVGSLQTVADKDRFATIAKLFCTAHAASACVMVLESWMSCAKPGESLEKNDPPSEAFDRKEVLVLVGEERGRTVAKALPIIRTDAGGFFGFGASALDHGTEVQGRFTGLLPPKMPTKEQRQLAATLLKSLDEIPVAKRRRG